MYTYTCIYDYVHMHTCSLCSNVWQNVYIEPELGYADKTNAGPKYCVFATLY